LSGFAGLKKLKDISRLWHEEGRHFACHAPWNDYERMSIFRRWLGAAGGRNAPSSWRRSGGLENEVSDRHNF
jgi:hypothetical protein